jgi:hypothetical protein
LKIGAVAYGIPMDVVRATRILVMAKYREHLSDYYLEYFENTTIMEKISEKMKINKRAILGII